MGLLDDAADRARPPIVVERVVSAALRAALLFKHILEILVCVRGLTTACMLGYLQVI
jgi:hypothetical protein